MPDDDAADAEGLLAAGSVEAGGPDAVATRAAISWSIGESCSGENGGTTRAPSASVPPDEPSSVDISKCSNNKEKIRDYRPLATADDRLAAITTAWITLPRRMFHSRRLVAHAPHTIHTAVSLTPVNLPLTGIYRGVSRILIALTLISLSKRSKTP